MHNIKFQQTITRIGKTEARYVRSAAEVLSCSRAERLETLAGSMVSTAEPVEAATSHLTPDKIRLKLWRLGLQNTPTWGEETGELSNRDSIFVAAKAVANPLETAMIEGNQIPRS